MATGLAIMVLLGLAAEWLARMARLPGLLGLLALGVALGPWALGWLNPETMAVSADWRLIALVVILLRAGLELSAEALARVGGRALLMAFVPCCCEVAVVTLVGPHLLGLSTIEAAVLGSVLAAVSPAVVVPLMVGFMQAGRGAEHGAPTLVLAGASCDDAVAIVLCSAFVGILVGHGEVPLAIQLASIPTSIILGALVGALAGWLLVRYFQAVNPRATKRVIMLLAAGLLLHQVEAVAQGWFASLICIMAIGFFILKHKASAAAELSERLGKLWIFASMLLFIYVGMEVEVPLAIDAGLLGAAVIAAGLAGRSIGVLLCCWGSPFTAGERVFIVCSYLPKATVQAAIGGVPLLALQQAGMDQAPGQLILAMAVLSIVITAPLGAILISWSGRRFLPPAQDQSSTTVAGTVA